jgi:hypothetical protein
MQKRSCRASGQNVSDAGRDLIHDAIRHMASGIAAEQPEHARSTEAGVQVRMPRDHVKVDVLEALSFGEERDIGLVAANDLPQRGRQVSEQRPEIGSFRRRQLVECDHVPAGQHNHPAGQRRSESVRHPPGRADVHPLPWRQIQPGVIDAAEAITVVRHGRIIPQRGSTGAGRREVELWPGADCATYGRSGCWAGG